MHPHRDRSSVDATVRELVRQLHRQVFELRADWHDLEEDELDPQRWSPSPRPFASPCSRLSSTSRPGRPG